jgi:hypothetical protein
MQRPTPTQQRPAQLPDEHEHAPAPLVGSTQTVSSDASAASRCQALMDPFCDAVLPPNQQACHRINDELCRPGSPFVRCLLGNSEERGCAVVGFLAECLCAPQTLVVGDAASAPAPRKH